MTCFCQKDNVNANNITRLELSEKIDVTMCWETGYHSNPVQNLKKIFLHLKVDKIWGKVIKFH